MAIKLNFYVDLQLQISHNVYFQRVILNLQLIQNMCFPNPTKKNGTLSFHLIR